MDVPRSDLRVDKTWVGVRPVPGESPWSASKVRMIGTNKCK